MSAEWTNVLTQIVIAVAQIVLAAAGVYSAFTIWKQQQKQANNLDLRDDAPALPPIAAKAPMRGENVRQLIELITDGDKEILRLLNNKYLKIMNRAAFRSMAMVLGPSAILSFVLSIVYVRLFPAPGPVIGMAMIAVCVLPISVIWGRVFYVTSNKASNRIWRDVGNIESRLEVVLAEGVKEAWITPDTLVSLHEELFRTMPRVTPAMINLADGVVISELVRRLNSTGSTAA